MTNAQCEAIIKAIGAAAEFLFYNGIRGWERVGDSETDASARTACIATLEGALQALVDDLPDENSDTP